jgi:hypothetical protein
MGWKEFLKGWSVTENWGKVVFGIWFGFKLPVIHCLLFGFFFNNILLVRFLPVSLPPPPPPLTRLPLSSPYRRMIVNSCVCVCFPKSFLPQRVRGNPSGVQFQAGRWENEGFADPDPYRFVAGGIVPEFDQASGSGFRIRIRIQEGKYRYLWPTKVEKIIIFHVLKCWMFSFESWMFCT